MRRRLVGLVVFFERVLKWERAVGSHLVGLVSLLCAKASYRSCCVFRTRLEIGGCRTKASCRSCKLVMCEGVL